MTPCSPVLDVDADIHTMSSLHISGELEYEVQCRREAGVPAAAFDAARTLARRTGAGGLRALVLQKLASLRDEILAL